MQEKRSFKNEETDVNRRTFYANLCNFSLARFIVIFLPWMCRSFILSRDSFSSFSKAGFFFRSSFSLYKVIIKAKLGGGQSHRRQSTNWYVSQSVRPSVPQAVNHSVNQLISQSVRPSVLVGKAVSHTFSRSVRSSARDCPL